MADVLQASPRNEWLGVPADILSKLRAIAEVAQSMGSAGEPAGLLKMLIGKTPELLDRMSYGGSVAEPPQETGPDPSLAAKYGGAIDAAGLVPAGKILGVAKSLAGIAPLGAALGHIQPISKEGQYIKDTLGTLAKPVEDLPTIDPSMSTMSQAPAIAHIPNDPALAEHLKYLADQGLGDYDTQLWQQYTRKSIPEISQQLATAEKNATEILGLRPGNTIVERKLESPFDTSPLTRGSTTPRDTITPPIELPPGTAARTDNSTGWPHPMTFASIRGGGYAGAYRNKLDVSGTANLTDLFDPHQFIRNDITDAYGNLTQPLHPLEQKFKDTYNQLKDLEQEGSLQLDPAFGYEALKRQAAGDTNSPIFRDPDWALKQWRMGGREKWEHTERPDVVATIQAMGYPGFLTKEQGTNVALFDPRLRFDKAAFDPAQYDSRNLFASLAGSGAGVSALAAMLLPQQEPPSQ